MKAIVLGDFINDIYIDCHPLGLSQEDVSIAVNPVKTYGWDGGAAVVMKHLNGLGVDVEAFFPAEVKKTRYRVDGKTLLRVNDVPESYILSHEKRREAYEFVARQVETIDMLLFADYNYGSLPNGLVHAISDLCRRHDVMMFADSQASSQTSDISRFQGMKLITPTEHEARLAMKDGTSDLKTVIKRLYALSGAENVVVTLGAKGVIAYDGRFFEYPALNQNPVDVCGAGDAFFAMASLCLARGEYLERAVRWGSVASAVHVGKVGNDPLTLTEVEDYASNLAGCGFGDAPEAANGQGPEVPDSGQRPASLGPLARPLA